MSSFLGVFIGLFVVVVVPRDLGGLRPNVFIEAFFSGDRVGDLPGLEGVREAFVGVVGVFKAHSLPASIVMDRSVKMARSGLGLVHTTAGGQCRRGLE